MELLLFMPFDRVSKLTGQIRQNFGFFAVLDRSYTRICKYTFETNCHLCLNSSQIRF